MQEPGSATASAVTPAGYDDMLVIDMLQPLDIAGRMPHLDFRPWFSRLQAGGIDAGHASVGVWQGAREAMRVIGLWRRRFLEYDDLIAPVSSAADLDSAKAAGKIGVMLGFQNTELYENNL